MAADAKPEAGIGAVSPEGQGRGLAEVLRHSSALQALDLDHPVIAVKFSASEPTTLPRLNKSIALCEMLKEAQGGEPFYASQDEQGCRAGSYVLGQIDHDPVMEGGGIGPVIGVYETAQANQRIYTDMVRFSPGSAPYTWFARLADLTFDPDLIIVTATPFQAEVILRAHGYKTGAAWEARGTTVIGCACLYAYPYLTGKLNILISGLHHGMRARKLFPEGLLFLAIPSVLITEVLDNLAIMEDKGLIDLPQYHWGKDFHVSHMRQVAEALAESRGGGG